MVGFAIGTGGIGVTVLGWCADSFGVPAALKALMLFPIAGVGLGALVMYPPQEDR